MTTTPPRVLLASERASQPWPNGGGMTRQVAIHPDAASTADFDWRVSIATVDGESKFSSYPGVTRWLMPLALDGLSLRIEGEVLFLPTREAFAFGGEASVNATKIRSPKLDLNLMVRNTYGRGSLLALVLRGETPIAAAADEFVVIVVLEGTPILDEVRLEELDAIALASGSDVVVEGDAVVAIARIATI
jgi:environmental stress-induced protein Ves